MRQRDYTLDFLKIIATIFIVFHHFQQLTGAHFSNFINFYGGGFYFGYMVELFFILSGFFMYTYMERIKNGLSFKNFFLLRFTRIFPLVTVAALSFELLIYIYKHVYHSLWQGSTPTFWGTIISSLGVQDGWVFENPHVNNPTWYLSVLLLCYILFYFIVYWANRISVNPSYLYIFMILIGIGIQTYRINLPFLNYSASRGYYSFFFGILLAQLLQKKEKLGLSSNKWDWLSLAIIIIIPLLIISHPGFMNVGLGYTMTFIFYPSLIVICRTTFVKRLLNKKIFGKIAKISFDVYIWHNLLLIIMYIGIKILDLSFDFNDFWLMIVFTLFSFIVGTISYYLIEMPINHYIKKVRSNLNNTE